MEQYGIFSILDSVDSTNNYAMGQIHEGLAKHGLAWFANTQTAGKAQRGKAWQSNPRENIILSIIVEPFPGTEAYRFSFNASVALACIDFLHSLTGESFTV
jgi:BirA family biotin operon repressor/biotin-[acetyl-CoA-carboxylase] ligase